MESAECEMELVRDSFGCLTSTATPDEVVLDETGDVLKTKAIDHDNNNTTTVEPMEVDEETTITVTTTNVEATLDAQCVQDTLQEVFIVSTDLTSTEEIPKEEQQVEMVEESEVATRETEEVEIEEEVNQTTAETIEEEEVIDEQVQAEATEEFVESTTVEEKVETVKGLEATDKSFELSQEDVEECTVVDEVAGESLETVDAVGNTTEETLESTHEETNEDEYEEAAVKEMENQTVEPVEVLESVSPSMTNTVELAHKVEEVVEEEEEDDEALEIVEAEEEEETNELPHEEVEELIIEEDEMEGDITIEEQEESVDITESLEFEEGVEEVTIEEEEEEFEEDEEVEMQHEQIELGEKSTKDGTENSLQHVEEMELHCAETMADDEISSTVLHPKEKEDQISQIISKQASTQNETVSIKTKEPDLYAEQSPPPRSQEVIEQNESNAAKSSSSFDATFIKQEDSDDGKKEKLVTADSSKELIDPNARGIESTATDKPTTTNEKKTDDETRQENGFAPTSSTASKSVSQRKVRPSTGFIDTQYPLCESHSLPFEKGYKREIVHRSVVMTEKSWKSVDVYYFTPLGRKMRSLREVSEYLEITNEKTLTTANFSFTKRRVSNSPFETSRTAKRRGAPSSSDGSPTAKKLCLPVTKKCPNMTVMVNKPKPEVKKNVQPASKLGAKNFVTVTKGKNIVIKRNEGELTTEVKRCSNHCPGQQGIIPTLQCIKCLCLFHPRCVGLVGSVTRVANFICKECGGTIAPLKTNPSSLVRLLSPSLIKNSLPNNNVAGNDSFSNRSPARTYLINDTPPRVTSTNVIVSPAWNVTPPNQTTNVRDAKHFPCGVTIEKIPPGTKPVSTELSTASISVIPMNRPTLFNRPTMTPITNIRSIIRPEFNPRGYPTNYLFPNLTNAMIRAMNRPTLVTTQSRPTLEQAKQSSYSRVLRAVTPAFQASKLNTNLKTTDVKLRVPMLNTEHAYTKSAGNGIQVSIVRQKRAPFPSPNPTNCFVSSLNGGFNSLLKIFKYLSLPDLLRAAQVCSTWREVAKHCSVWETVVLKNVRVKNWEMFGRIAPSLSIQQLDMRGMPISDNRDVTFRGILLLSSKIKNLQILHLCEVPAYIVHTVTTQHPNLKCFTSEWITEGNKDNSQNKCNLDLGKFGKMVNLETLQLRGINGLYLLGKNLKELGSLYRLTRLCVTSLRDVPSSQFIFLDSLPNLRTLELGECLEWTEEVYEAIGNMTNLSTLRLEFGGDCAERGVEIILSSLQNLVRLELIIFRIPPNFGELLEQMRSLRHMTIWPDMQCRPDHNNYNTVRSTKFIPFVKTLMWGLVTSCLHDNNQLATGGDSQLRIDHNSCCIPFLSFSLGSTAPTTTYISAHQLMNKLRSELPQSKVQVVMVPNSSYRTIAYMPR